MIRFQCSFDLQWVNTADAVQMFKGSIFVNEDSDVISFNIVSTSAGAWDRYERIWEFNKI